MITELSPGVYRIGVEVDSEGNRAVSIVTGEGGLAMYKIAMQKAIEQLQGHLMMDLDSEVTEAIEEAGDVSDLTKIEIVMKIAEKKYKQ